MNSNAIPTHLIVQELMHGIFALPFALFLYKKTKSIKYFFAVIILTYVLDVDHLVDYFLYFGLRFNLADFLSGIYFEATKRAVVPLHAWEWLIVLSFAAKKKGWDSLYTVFTLSLLAHLIYDTFTVGSPLFYSIIYRALMGFTNLV